MITAFATYAQPAAMTSSILIICLLFVVVGMPCISIWNFFGASLKKLLQQPGRARVFNIFMAVVLLGSMYPLFQ
jgi:threonine/homoserine/homoserine lactone efflux protein